MQKMSASVVIVGAGLAAWSVVEALRALDKDLGIVMISQDRGDRYQKPMLSASLAQKRTAKSLIRATGQEAANALGIVLVQGEVIDAHHKTVCTKDMAIGYEHLVLAIGASPIYPPCLKEADKAVAKRIFHVNHWDNFLALEEALTQKNDELPMAILGAGMVGVEMAEDLVGAGVPVLLLDKNPTPLAKMIPPMAGERLAYGLAKIGVEAIYGTHIEQISAEPTGLLLSLQGGRTIQVWGLLVCTGLVVDGALPKMLGLNFDERLGILVDDKLGTGVPNVYALGDCICVGDAPCRYVAPHRAQAATIAHAITGTPFGGYVHSPPPIRLKNKSVVFRATGNPRACDDWTVVSDEAGTLTLSSDQGATISLTLAQP